MNPHLIRIASIIAQVVVAAMLPGGLVIVGLAHYFKRRFAKRQPPKKNDK